MTRTSTRPARSRSSSPSTAGLGGAQTRPFILHPAELPLPEKPIIGAEHVHAVLRGWRQALSGQGAGG